MENELISLILKSQQGDKDSIIEIINKFMPLIKKYSRELAYDGAESDLSIALIAIIKSYPVYKNNKVRDECEIISYISISIRHKFIELSKKNCKITTNETLLNEDMYLTQSANDIDDMVFVNELLDKLPIKQKQLLTYLFINEYSESEIALKLNVSRQYINKIKKKALNNLKQYI